eukprot:5482500-Amphidinium_carterae.2
MLGGAVEKAVTDGHVVFTQESLSGDTLQWCIDLSQSVARGVTADTVQNRPLHELRSLELKFQLMQQALLPPLPKTCFLSETQKSTKFKLFQSSSR